MREFINGADAISRAALDAGCDFFAGYPITPATPILLNMVRELPLVGGIAIQAEDEIAAIGMCIGAAIGGKRVLTATSGPGISLYSENIGLAIMGEVPMVIVNCQRMGPATGAATTTSQGDIQFMRWGTSGGLPLIVLAPVDAADAYACTRQAFELAERFRVPVIIATDKETVSAAVTLDGHVLTAEPLAPRRILPTDQPFRSYNPDKPAEVVPLADMDSHIVRFNTSSHDPEGYLTKKPERLAALNRHLEEKILAHADAITRYHFDRDDGARTLFISYGISAASTQQAVLDARKKGHSVSCLTLTTLWPVPESILKEALSGMERVIVVEMNNRQYRREIDRLAHPEQEVRSIISLSGELISPVRILAEGGVFA